MNCIIDVPALSLACVTLSVKGRYLILCASTIAGIPSAHCGKSSLTAPASIFSGLPNDLCEGAVLYWSLFIRLHY
jgi:hypothetical protein